MTEQPTCRFCGATDDLVPSVQSGAWRCRSWGPCFLKTEALAILDVTVGADQSREEQQP